jgi:hypothetical protein
MQHNNGGDRFNASPMGNYGGGVGRCGKNHDGMSPVKIGGKDVWLTGTMRMNPDSMVDKNLIVSLTGKLPVGIGSVGVYLPMYLVEMRDYGGVPNGWKNIISIMAEFIQKNNKLIAYCAGSHGRTGCFAASLIALMEPDVKDPIAAIRERHCHHAVETLEQARAVFAIRGKSLPKRWVDEFVRTPMKTGDGYHFWPPSKKAAQQTTFEAYTDADGAGNHHSQPASKEAKDIYNEEFQQWLLENGLE